MDLFTPVAEQYREWALSAEDSPTLRDWALGVAEDPDVQAWIARLPQLKQQPNLVFAAARWHGVRAPGPYAGLRDTLLGPLADRIRSTVLARATQTNEVGRLATLLPAFARLSDGRPMALLEVGCSAGLNLYPDAWSYSWALGSDTVTAGAEGSAGVLPCRVTGRLSAVGMPVIGWRGGIDLNPLDVTSTDQMDWLVNLVWPEQEHRRERLRAAIEVARRAPGPRPRIVAGDLVAELPSLVAEAAATGCQVVVFHSAVIAYLDDEERSSYRRLIGSLVDDGACHWVSNEGQRVLPDLTATLPSPPADPTRFVLAVDGRAVGLTHGHGAELDWLG